MKNCDHVRRFQLVLIMSVIFCLAVGRLHDNPNDKYRNRPPVSPSVPTTQAPFQLVEINTTAPVAPSPKPNNLPRAPMAPKPRGPTLAPVAPCVQVAINSCSTDVNDLAAVGPCPCGSPIYQVNLEVTAQAPTAAFALLGGFGNSKALVFFASGIVQSTELDDSGTPLDITCVSGGELSVALLDASANIICTQDFFFPFA